MNSKLLLLFLNNQFPISMAKSKAQCNQKKQKQTKGRLYFSLIFSPFDWSLVVDSKTLLTDPKMTAVDP